MYSFDHALAKAKERAIKRKCDMHVFYEGEWFYDIGNDYDAETFFAGSDPVCTFNAEGESLFD